MDIPKVCQPYVYWGTRFEEETTTGELIGNCIFCKNRVDKFFVNKKTAAFQCKHGSCAKSGSWKYFLKELYVSYLQRTTDQDLLPFVQHEGLPLPAVKKAKVAKIGNKFVVPIYNPATEIIDLRSWRKGYKEHSTGGCQSGIFNCSELVNSTNNIPVYLCGSFRDAIALDWLLVRTNTKGIVCGTPGENSFKEEWISYFDSKDVTIIFDNDTGGYGYYSEDTGKCAGSKKVEVRLTNTASSIKHLTWDNKHKEGYDVKDFINEYKKQPYDAWKILQSYISYKHVFDLVPSSNGTTTVTNTGEKVTLEQIRTKCRELYEVDEAFDEALKIGLATALTVKIPGKSKVWMFLMGQPGCGKTIICELFETAKTFAVCPSNISCAALISGFGLGQNALDPSLLAKVNKKCLVFKDFTEVIDKRPNERDEIFSILRGAYDGRVEKVFGNGVRKYKTTFSCLAGVTHKILKFSDTEAGARFLYYEMDTGKRNAEKTQLKAVQGQLYGAEKEKELQTLTAQFFLQPFMLTAESLTARIPRWFRDQLFPLVQVMAAIRTRVPRHESGLRFGAMEYKPVIEAGNRLAVQLEKLALGLALIEEKAQIDEDIYKLILKVARSTIRGFPYDIVKFLINNKHQTPQEIFAATGVEQIGDLLKDLRILNIIEVIEGEVKQYNIRKGFKDLWVRAKL